MYTHPSVNIYGREVGHHSSRQFSQRTVVIAVACVQKGGEANTTANRMANVFRISRTLGVLEHLGSVLLRTTTMLIHWLDLDMVSGSRRRRGSISISTLS